MLGKEAASRSEWTLACAVALVILFFNAAWVSAHLGVAHRVRDVLETDHRHYIHMALAPQELEEPPYAFRVATPALARALMRNGASVNAAFYAITQASLVAFLAFTFLFLRALNFDRTIAVVVLMWMGLSQGAVRWFEYQYWMSDPPCLALVASALYFIESERWLVAIPLAFVAGSVRESFVLVLPYAALHAWRVAGARAAIARTLAIGLAFFSVALFWRSRIVPASVDDWRAGIADSMDFRIRHAFDNQWYVLTIGTWGVFLAFALFDFRTFARRAFERIDLTALVGATYASLIISNNTERPLAYAWPAVAAAGAAGLQTVRTRASGHLFRIFVAGATCVQVAHFLATRWYQLMGSSLYQPARWDVTAFVAALAVCLVVSSRNSAKAAR